MTNPDDQPEIDFGFRIPAGRETFRTWEVARIINHTRKQVEVLIEENKFGKTLNGGARNKKSWVVSRAGLLKFLKENTH